MFFIDGHWKEPFDPKEQPRIGREAKDGLP